MMKTNFIGNTMIYNELLLLSFFQEKKWHRSKKLDKNKCPFLYYEMENLFLKKKKWVHTIML